MTEGQRIIKYMAMFVAGGLTLCILAVLVNVGIGVMDTMVLSDMKGKDETVEVKVDEYPNIENLKIESSIYKISVKENEDGFQNGVIVKSENMPSSYKVNYKQGSRTLSARDDNWISGLFGERDNRKKSKVTIYIPRQHKLKDVHVQMGVGSVELNSINMENLDAECGAGSFSCKSVNADLANIEGGFGKVKCKDIEFSGLQLSGSVGDVEVEGKLLGKTEVSAGIGNISIDISGRKEDYNYKVETGLGTIYFDGKKTGDTNEYNNSQTNLIDVEGGIGSIQLDFN